MTESRWAHWSPGTLKTGLRTIGQFMEQAPVQAGMGSRSAAEEAAAKGLTHAGYGYYKDSSGQVVAQSRDGVLVMIDQTDKMQPSQVDMGNPTGEASGQTPADKARSMGLISDGSGSYKDSQGNTIARTVNNELVFYDSRAGGGAVSDGSGGAQITQSSPSWVDPVTGLIVVPPAQPESPEEINAVPDPTPATAPAGYDAFVNKKKREMYAANAVQNEIEQDVQRQQAEVQELYSNYPHLDETRQNFQQKIDNLSAQIEQNPDPEAQAKLEKKLDKYVTASQIFDEELTEFTERFGHMDDAFQAELAEQELNYQLFKQFTAPIDQKISEVIEMEESGQISKEVADKNLQKFNEMKSNFKFNGLDLQRRSQMMNQADQQREKPTQQVDGDLVRYNLHSSVDKFSQDGDQEVRKYGDAFASQLETYGFTPDEIEDAVEVSWDTQPFWFDKNPDMDEATANKKAAFDALKTWRSKILPSLNPGTILYNTPVEGGRQFDDGSNSRERIYSLAGFGDFDKKGELEGQFGLVIDRGDGTNEVVPLNLKKSQRSVKRKRKLKEELLQIIVDYYGNSLDPMSQYKLLESFS